MTSRERVLSAIDHVEPDRVPVDFGSTPSSGISATAYARLAKKMGMASSKVRVYDVVQELAEPENWALDRFGVDAVDLGRTFNTDDAKWYDTTLAGDVHAQYPRWFQPERASDGSLVAANPDGLILAKKPSGATFFDQTVFPYESGYPSSFVDLPSAMNLVMWQALAHSPWDHAGEVDFWQNLRRRALALRENTDRAIVVVAGCNLFEWGTFLRRLDNFLVDLYTDQAQVEALLDALMEIHLQTLECVCTAVGDIADILRFGDDLGLDTAPFMSPAVYRRFFKPRHAALCAYVKTHSRMRTYLHSCGSIYELLPDLIDAGYDVLNPIQTNARNMEPERLKREFGADICFWGGGVDTRTTLNLASPDQVRDEVRRRIETFAPGGGFVFNTVHNILPDVPPANIIAMFDAVAEFG